MVVATKFAPATLPTRKEAIAHVKQMLEQLLIKAAAEKRTISYEELDALIHDDVRKNYRGVLSGVLKSLLVQNGIYFKAKRGEGLRLVSDDEKLRTVGTQARKKIENETDRWGLKLNGISHDALKTQDDIKAYTREQLKLNLQRDLNDGAAALRVEAAVEAVANAQKLERSTLAQTLHAANERMQGLG